MSLKKVTLLVVVLTGLYAFRFNAYLEEKERAEAYRAQIGAVCKGGELLFYEYHREHRASPPISIYCTQIDPGVERSVQIVWEKAYDNHDNVFGFTARYGGQLSPYARPNPTR